MIFNFRKLLTVDTEASDIGSSKCRSDQRSSGQPFQWLVCYVVYINTDAVGIRHW